MNPTDFVNAVNGTLRTVGFGLIAIGALQITNNNLLAGGILLVAGLVANILYEVFPDKPTTTTIASPTTTVVTTTTPTTPPGSDLTGQVQP